MFKCKNQEMKDFRNHVYTELYRKLREMDTSPLILEIMTNGLQGNLSGKTHESRDLNKLTHRFKVIGQFNLLNGFIPVGSCEIQHKFYIEEGSRKQGKTWGTKLVDLLMEAALSIWNKRNSMEHNRVAHGLSEVENIRLSLEVDKQLRLGLVGVKRKDKSLFKYTKKKIWAQSGEWIRSWLASVYIARNQMQQAKEELNLLRGKLTYIRKRPERLEIRQIEKERKEQVKRKNLSKSK